MPHIHQRKYHPSHLHKVKRLHNSHRYGNGGGEHMMIKNLPNNIIDENSFNRTSKYIKFFDYPLAQLLVDHSTNPLQNTTRQYIDTSLTSPPEGRFVNHEMIIRRNGETTILRPKHDLVLANGFTPVIRPSSILPSYHSIISDSQVASSLSIMNKMSVKKCEQTSIIKSKRKNRRHQKRCNEIFSKQNNLSNYNFSNNFKQQHNSQESNFIHLVEQALHEMIEQKTPSPPPLMSILPQFHSPYNQSFTPRLEESYINRNTNSNQQSFIPPLTSILTNRYTESFYDTPPELYRSFERNHQSSFNNVPPFEQFHLNSSITHQRNYTQMSGYFFDCH